MKTTLTLFTVSFVSTVAAGWSRLDAVQDANGPEHKPVLGHVQIDGNDVIAKLDRDRVTAGGKVQLSLGATRTGEVRVTVQEQSMMMDSRMEPPARTISSKIVEVGPDGVVETIELAGALREDDADPLLTAGSAVRYSILVGSDQHPNGAAVLPVFAYEPEAYRLTVEAPTPGGVGEPADVQVRVENLSKKALTGLSISLSSTFVAASDTASIASLEAGDETTVTIHGTRVETQDTYPLVVQAFGYATYGGTSSAYLTVDPR